MMEAEASGAAGNARNRTPLDEKERLGYLLVSPALIVLTAALVLPLIYNLWLSLYDYNFLRPQRTEFVGFANYIKAFSDPNHRYAILFTLFYTAVAVVIEVALGTGLAFILNMSFRGNRLLRTLILLPMLVSEVVAGLSWRLLFHADIGLLNYLIGFLGIPPQVWLGPDLAITSTIIVEVWQHTPFVTLIMLAGLQAMPKELLEASAMDGASKWEQFRYVILPVLSPIILLALVFRTMFTLRVFTPVWVLTSGGPADQTLVVGVDIYRTAFRYYEFGMAATLSIVLLAITLVITLVYMRLLGRESLS